jgi:hypothetical protein
MRETTTTVYACEICSHEWSAKEFAERCEAIGYPQNYNKLIGKWIIVPTSVYFSKEKSETSFDFFPEKLWRVVRIDSNYITNLNPNGFIPTTGSSIGQEELQLQQSGATSFEKEYAGYIDKLHHRLVVQCKGFEDNSRVESMSHFFDVPEEMFEYLNSKLVQMELDRRKDKGYSQAKFGATMTRFVAQFFTSHEFDKHQHDLAELVLKEVLEKTKKELPVIKQEELPSIIIQAN